MDDTFTLFLRDIIAGGFSGIFAKTVIAPIERIKLLLQTQRVNSRIEQTKRYSSTRACIQEIVQKEGFLSLWRGNMANVIRYFPNQAFNFAMKDKFRRFFGISKEEQQRKDWTVVFWKNILAGSAAGSTTALLTYPLDMVRTRMAADVAVPSAVAVNDVRHLRQFNGVYDCIQQSYADGGLVRVYRGFPVSLFGAALFRGLFFGGYDNLKHMFNLEEESFFVRYLVAQSLTTVVGTLCYPIDTIKRRMMIQTNFDLVDPLSASSVDHRMGYMNGRECFRYVLRNEGVKGLYSGLVINLVRGVSGALLLVCYDEVKKIVNTFCVDK